jgi:AraC family transcriptional regulator of adaptative response/methylated-DNA-[protein]-cysteine methyltransferase
MDGDERATFRRMKSIPLPSADEMYAAVAARDARLDGAFFTAVKSTGIFCRPGCPARTPKRENVEFFATAHEAACAGYRPCKRCRPLEPAGAAPEWLRGLIADLEREPGRRWTAADLRARGLEPSRVRRWFQRHHGVSFHAYARARRVGNALGHLGGGAPIARTAFENGYESVSAFYSAVKQLSGTTPGGGRDKPVVRIARIHTSLGPMLAAATGDALCLLEFVDRPMLETQLRRVQKRLGAVLVPGPTEVTRQTERELAEYFAGERLQFTVPLAVPGTPFQQRVWDELRTIPYGGMRSYAEQARAAGAPTSVRAVAHANGDNRIAILIPCHRVVGSDGSLTGYGGGLWRKQRLLELERETLRRATAAAAD